MAAALERALGAAERASPAEPLLVLGPAGSGRTALLLRAALAGGGAGPRALLLAPAAIPSLPRGADPRALQRLELRYPPSLGALCRELGAASARPRRPGLLLLDGLERYLGGVSAGGAARLAALLLEATRSPGPPAQVLASLRLPPPSPRVLPVLRRYFPAECRLRPSPGAPQRLRLRITRPGAPPRRWRLRFGAQGRLHVATDDDTDGDSEDGGDGDTSDDTSDPDEDPELSLAPPRASPPHSDVTTGPNKDPELNLAPP